MKIKVFNPAGEQVGSEDFPVESLGEVEKKILYHAVNDYLANQRQGTSSAKTRAQVRGGGRKPWRQKGTGRARVGSSRSPLWRGGGVTFGPAPRSYTRRTPASLKKRAIAEALKDKLFGEKLVLIDGYTDIEPKTRVVAGFIGKALLAGRVTFFVGGEAKNFRLAGRNIPDVKFADPGAPNAYHIINSDYLVIGRDCWKNFAERLVPSGKVSETVTKENAGPVNEPA